MKRRTRFERIAPAPPKSKAQREGQTRRYNPRWWIDKARQYGRFPFEVEVAHEHIQKRDALDDQEGPEVIRTVTREFNHHQVPNILKSAIENGLHQAYLSGIDEGVRQMEIIQVILQMHAPRNKKIQKEVADFIKDFKKQVSEGRKRLY